MFNILAARLKHSTVGEMVMNAAAEQAGIDLVGDDEDGLLYPVYEPRAQGGARREPDDGSDCHLVEVTGITLLDTFGAKDSRLFHLSNSRASALITDSRVVVLCEKWRTGPSAHVLMEHVRYNWLQAVGWGRQGPFGSKQLRIVCIDGMGPDKKRQVKLDLSLGRGVDGRALVDEIAARAATYYLCLDRELNGEQLAGFRALAEGRGAPITRGNWLYQKPPVCQRVNFETVYSLDSGAGAAAAGDTPSEAPDEEPRI